MPSTLAPNRLSASSRRALSREARPPWVGEVTLSQELRTARSPRPHVLVGYQWSHTGLRPGRKTSHNRYIRSFVSHPPTDPGLHITRHPVPHLMNSRPARSVVGTWTWFRSRCTCQMSHPDYPVRSGSLCGRRCLMLLLTCLFENPMSRRMVAEYARLHLLMPTTAGAGCFPPAIAPRAWQSLPHALAQLGRCRYLAQQREQRIHLDQLADCHHLPLHVVEQLLVGNLLRLTCLVRRQVARTTCSALYISRQNDI